MQNEMRDRLIELIKKVPYGVSVGATFEQHFCEKVANHLIENDVILPPVKVGDTVYCPVLGTNTILKTKVFSVGIDEYGDSVINPKEYPEDVITILGFTVGENVFLTREEAEKTLKEKQNESKT